MGDKPRTKRPLPIAVVSDLHVGCGLAVMPADGVSVDGQQTVFPSPFQQAMNGWWSEFWEWVEDETDGRYAVVVNGDLVDGVHHQATTQWTHNMDVQRSACVELLKPVRKRAERFLIVRGTETHVGGSGQHEEAIARELDAEKSASGTHSHWEIYYRLGKHLVHFSHHIGVTSSPFAESGALNREMVQGYVEAGRNGDEPPAILIRSHRHTCGVFGHPSRHGMTWTATTPAWQGKTPYVHRTAARMQRPQIGGMLIVAGDNAPYCKPWVRFFSRPEEV